MRTEQVPVPVQAPLHPSKLDEASGSALRSSCGIAVGSVRGTSTVQGPGLGHGGATPLTTPPPSPAN